MLLGVRERLVLLNILPKEGNAITLRILKEFQMELSFTEDEKAAISLKDGDGRLTWDEKSATEKEIEVGTTMNEIIVGTLSRMDASKSLTMDHLPLYERFVSP